METISIPKEFLREKELVIVPRRELEKLLRRSKQFDDVLEKRFWQRFSIKHFLKMYDDSRDSIYDKL